MEARLECSVDSWGRNLCTRCFAVPMGLLLWFFEFPNCRLPQAFLARCRNTGAPKTRIDGHNLINRVRRFDPTSCRPNCGQKEKPLELFSSKGHPQNSLSA